MIVVVVVVVEIVVVVVVVVVVVLVVVVVVAVVVVVVVEMIMILFVVLIEVVIMMLRYMNSAHATHRLCPSDGTRLPSGTGSMQSTSPAKSIRCLSRRVRITDTYLHK